MADFGPINASPSPLVFRNSPVPVSPSPLITCGEARAGDTVHYCSSLFHEGILFFWVHLHPQRELASPLLTTLLVVLYLVRVVSCVLTVRLSIPDTNHPMDTLACLRGRISCHAARMDVFICTTAAMCDLQAEAGIRIPNHIHIDQQFPIPHLPHKKVTYCTC
jgi:hypothetical protein